MRPESAVSISMPLPERPIVPVNVCRGTLQLPVPDELEGVTNGSLANIIRQLSTLSRHAEEMFGNLFQEAEGKHYFDSFDGWFNWFNNNIWLQVWPPGAPVSRRALTSSLSR